MKKSELRQIIREEIKSVLKESKPHKKVTEGRKNEQTKKEYEEIVNQFLKDTNSTHMSGEEVVELTKKDIKKHMYYLRDISYPGIQDMNYEWASSEGKKRWVFSTDYDGLLTAKVDEDKYPSKEAMEKDIQRFKNQVKTPVRIKKGDGYVLVELLMSYYYYK